MHPKLRLRQVHLDFHTSENIPRIGESFRKKEFQEALKLGRVNSITLFSKCHHGHSYHPVKVGQMHPHLKFDLLKAQIEAAHEIGVRTPVYLSSGHDENYLRLHPEHAMVHPVPPPFATSGPTYTLICTNTAYTDHLSAQIDEVLANYDADGIFLDIVGARQCICAKCVADMKSRGLNPDDEAHREKFAMDVFLKYAEQTRASAEKIRPGIRFFQNAGHINRGDYRFLNLVSHLELESLPTGGWGYDHFPLSAKYAAMTGMAYIGMTGKFHSTWGEFGGFKHPNALRYECAAMVAFGAGCSVGDQMHPSGEMNFDTYERIGMAYAEIEAAESWLHGARPLAEIAMLSIESITTRRDRDRADDTGATRMLLEAGLMFDVVDGEMDFSPYKVLIVPDHGRLTPALAEKLNAYLDGGGRVVLSYESGLAMAKDEFLLPVGEFKSRTEHEHEFLVANPDLVKKYSQFPLVKSPFVILSHGINAVPPADAPILVRRRLPYFNRTHENFTSHQHAPDEKDSPFAEAWIAGKILYFSHPIFSCYTRKGQLLYRDLFRACLREFLGKPFQVETALPSAGRVSLMEQSSEDRAILHLLYATPHKRGGDVFARWNIKDIEVIEDIVPLYDIRCEVRLSRPVKSVYLAPQKADLLFRQEGDRVSFTVPRIEGRQMVVLSYL